MTPAQPPDHRLSSSRASLLVVEDEALVARDVEMRLRALGYNVVGVVGTGEEGVEAALRLRPQLVLMDVRLRGAMDGITAAEQIRAASTIPIVFLTAYSEEETLRRARKTDPSGYLLKPFEERELQITIELALAKHQFSRDLVESKRQLDTILRSIGEGVIAADPDGSITFMNPEAVALTGWLESEAKGRPILEVFRATGGGVRTMIGSALPGIPSSSDSGPGPLLLTRDGRTVPIEVNAAPLRDADGRTSGTVVIFRDVSQRENSERALRQSEERYRSFFEEDLTGDYIASGDGTILECNPAFVRMLGFASAAEARGKNLHERYPDREACERFLDRLRRERRLTYHEKELRALDGRRVHVIENVSAILDGRGILLSYKGYLFDDTDRKHLEEQLHHMQKMESIGTFASGIAHDFNNIINNIIGFASQMRKHADDPAKVLKYAQTVEKSATRGAELSTQLLSFARVGRRELKVMNPGDVVEEVATLCGETFPKQIRVERSVARDLDSVLGDQGGIYQVLMNLCVNARDALMEREAGQGGLIRLSARNSVASDPLTAEVLGEGTPCVELCVEDNGVGIPRDLLDRIFDPFFTTKERGKGTGLGLAVAYNIVRSHRGVLAVESQEGRGSVFRMTLPSAPRAAEPATAEESREMLRGAGETVLVVDDEESMQELARDLLEDAGYRVLTAGSGVQAIEVYRAEQSVISLVVLDLVMPGLDGGQTYLELRRINPKVKAFFCTGYMPDQVIASILEADHIQAVQKPFKPDAFVRIVRETIDREDPD